MPSLTRPCPSSYALCPMHYALTSLVHPDTGLGAFNLDVVAHEGGVAVDDVGELAVRQRQVQRRDRAKMDRKQRPLSGGLAQEHEGEASGAGGDEQPEEAVVQRQHLRAGEVPVCGALEVKEAEAADEDEDAADGAEDDGPARVVVRRVAVEEVVVDGRERRRGEVKEDSEDERLMVEAARHRLLLGGVVAAFAATLEVFEAERVLGCLPERGRIDHLARARAGAAPESDGAYG